MKRKEALEIANKIKNFNFDVNATLEKLNNYLKTTEYKDSRIILDKDRQSFIFHLNYNKTSKLDRVWRLVGGYQFNESYDDGQNEIAIFFNKGTILTMRWGWNYTKEQYKILQNIKVIILNDMPSYTFKTISDLKQVIKIINPEAKNTIKARCSSPDKRYIIEYAGKIKNIEQYCSVNWYDYAQDAKKFMIEMWTGVL